MTEPTTERTIVRGGVSAATIAADPETGKAIWPPQPDMPPIEDGPEQVYRDVPAGWDGWSHAARLVAEGWQPPLPALDECIRQREALRLALRRIVARRNGDVSRISAAVRHAADLIEPDPAAGIVEAIEAVALDRWAVSVGSDDSDINLLSYQLEDNWRQLCYRHQRAILKSLIGRDSPAANSLRAFVQGMDGLLKLPSLGRNEYIVRL